MVRSCLCDKRQLSLSSIFNPRAVLFRSASHLFLFLSSISGSVCLSLPHIPPLSLSTQLDSLERANSLSPITSLIKRTQGDAFFVSPAWEKLSHTRAHTLRTDSRCHRWRMNSLSLSSSTPSQHVCRTEREDITERQRLERRELPLPRLFMVTVC